MSNSITFSDSITFNITHAKQLAAKVATDLKRMQRFYSSPTDSRIQDYEEEIVALLKNGYLDVVTYGFKRNGNWIVPTLKYTARDLAGGQANDEDPGRVPPGANVSEASFYSYLITSSAYDNLSTTEKEEFSKSLPFKRGEGIEPGVNGYFSDDRTYSAGGRALNRSSVKSY